MEGLSGFALAGYLNDLERQQKKAASAIDIHSKSMNASEDYQGAQKRTDSWLASLSPEDLAKVDSSTKKAPSNFEGIGDVSRFDADRSARDLGLTSTFASMPEVQAYFKSNQDVLSKKKDAEINKALEDALSEMNRNKQAQGLNELEEQAGVPKGDYKLSSPRDVAVKYGLPKYEDKRVDRFMTDFVTDPEANATKVNIANNRGSSGLGATTARKREDWNKIATLPDGPEKDAAIDDYMMVYAPGTKYPLSQRGIDEASQKAGSVAASTINSSTGPKVNQELALIEPRTKAKIEETKAGLQATKEEGAILSETSAERLGDFDASISQMGELLTGLNNPDAPQGPIEQWKKVNPYDWKAQGKQQLVAATKQLVGKALEGGVLRKEDEEKYAKILPTMGDTYESAKLKTEQLSAMLNNAYVAKRSALKNAGYDVKNFSGGVSVGKKEPVKPTSEYNPTLVEDETTAALKRSKERQARIAELNAKKLAGKLR